MLPAYFGFLGKPTLPVTYLLEDDFTTDDAAPIATPRTCEPTGTLVFTGASNFDISSAQLNIASPSAWNTAGFRDNTIRTRTAGRRFYAKFTVTSATLNRRGYFAWNSVAGINYDSPATWSFLLFANGSTIDLYLMDTAANTYGIIANIAINTEYQLLIIQRTNGYFVYIKGGAFSNWTILHILSTGNADAYAAFGNHSLLAKVNRLAMINNLWMPIPRVSDSFNGRDGNGNNLYVSRYGSNPIITVNPGNPNESLEQYEPAPICLDNGDIWVYCKGSATIYAWKSTDNGETFSLQNSNNPVISPVAVWEGSYTLEPSAVFDSANSLIHIYYRGGTGATAPAVGHATAPDTDPTNVTKDGGNPILTAANFKTQLGLAANPTDLTISDVIKIGSTYYFYGYYLDGTDGKGRIWYGTGSDWNNVTAQAAIISPNAVGGDLVQFPSVYKFGSTYYMIFASGFLSTASTRRLRIATSSNGTSWALTPSQVLAPEDGGTWENRWVYCASVLKESSSPFVAPIEINNKYLLYYSGFNASTNKGQIGLTYLQDNGSNAVETNFPVGNTIYFGVSDGLGDPDGRSGGSNAVYDGTVDGLWKLSSTTIAPAGEAPTDGGGAWIITYQSGVSDGVAISKVTVGTNSTAGLIFRYTNNNNWWAVLLSDVGNKISIYEMNAGTLTERANTSVTITGGTEYTVVVVLNGQTITAYLNNTTKVSYGSAALNQTEKVHGLRGATTSDLFNSITLYPLTESVDIGDN